MASPIARRISRKWFRSVSTSSYGEKVAIALANFSHSASISAGWVRINSATRIYKP